MVESADKEYTIVVTHATSVFLVVDGQDVVALTTGARVTVRQAPVSFQLVKVPGQSYYRTLHDKLNWGTPPNYRESEPKRG